MDTMISYYEFKEIIAWLYNNGHYKTAILHNVLYEDLNNVFILLNIDDKELKK